MLLKKIKLKYNVIVDILSCKKETVIFRRVYPRSSCTEEINFGHPEKNDSRCFYRNDCPLKYTCSTINNYGENIEKHYSYIPQVKGV